MLRKWRRIPLIVAAAIVVGLSISAPSAGEANAASLPTASCYDGLFYDGLETRYTAGRCRAAAAAKGYDAAAYHNSSAQSQLTRLPTDGVYFFAGHSIVVGDLETGGAPYAAVGLMHESPRAGGNVDALVGDPVAAPLLQGPQQLCDETGRDCRDVVLTSYPWATELSKHNLVVLQSCNTAGGNSLFAGLAETAQLAGAGTVIGFRDLVAFPVRCRDCDVYGIKWARVFWQSLRYGATYKSATVSATNAVGGGYGYSSYRILTNPGAPQRLGPAQYYVWPAGPVRVPVGTSSDAELDATLATWLGNAPPAGAWHDDSSGGTGTARSYRPGLGLFTIDTDTDMVTEAVFEAETDGGPRRIDADTALRIARRFVTEHDDLAGRRLRDVELIDHGDFSEFVVSWQERRGAAWLPARVIVGVNAATGNVLSFSKDATVTTVGTTPAVTREQAAHSARTLVSSDDWAARSAPRLEVTVDHEGRQRLVWVQEFARTVTGPGIAQGVVVWTDARSGVSFIQARS